MSSSAPCAPAKVLEIDQHLHRLDAVLAQFGQRLRRALVDAVGDDDGAALRAEPLRRGAADALPGAGDDADLALQPAGARLLWRPALPPWFPL